MTEILFIVEEDESGGYSARAVGAGIFTQADTRDELVKNIREAVHCHYDHPEQIPPIAHLHYVHDETVSLQKERPNGSDIAHEDVRVKLFGSILKDDDPFGPAAPPEDWEAMR